MVTIGETSGRLKVTPDHQSTMMGKILTKVSLQGMKQRPIEISDEKTLTSITADDRGPFKSPKLLYVDI